MSKRLRKSEDGFNLAFLDVMACGLGAVILIFMLVDFHSSSIDPTEELEKLQAELKASEEEQTLLNRSIDEVNTNTAMETNTEQELQKKIQQIQAELDDTRKAIANEQAVIADLDKQKAAVSEKAANASLVQKVGVGEQNYIVGLPVTGKYIGILVDKSASMMEIKLPDILLASVLPDSQKKTQPKWVRTKNIAKWLVSRLPNNAKATVVAYSESAQVLGGKNLLDASSAEQLGQALQELERVIPSGGTNLKAGLDALKRASPQVDSVYILTDGLPTLGYKSLSKCSLRKKTISAQCRAEMGNKTLEEFRISQRRAKLNVILLPLEGDRYASSVYWNATWKTNGKMLSPAQEWN